MLGGKVPITLTTSATRHAAPYYYGHHIDLHTVR
eukprot:SAG11_NODE_34361_length_272_cov_0.895954_1_plen_33_part_10